MPPSLGPRPYADQQRRDDAAEAVALHQYAVQAVPGMLQTPAYAHSLFEHRRPSLPRRGRPSSRTLRRNRKDR
ncbi:Scr1 family TA system antitoxin-like transcriptional regulator [Streptomyces sp. NPDC059593]|uniref:Scr1 family TA system antitoxin-like transcriptional regulator n=1 Tax=Streptomyces sp. NPDC059593 TaxID=3346878 RepID=UPI0036C5A478